MTDTITLPRSVVEQALKALNASMPHNNDMDQDWPSHIAARRTLRAALEQPQGEVVVTTNQQGHCVAVTRQDEEGRILSVVWESKHPQGAQEPVAYRHMHEDGWEYYDAPTGSDCDECQPLYTHRARGKT